MPSLLHILHHFTAQNTNLLYAPPKILSSTMSKFAVLWTAFHAAGEKAGPPDVLCEAFGMAGLPQVQLLSYANNSKRIAVFACYF
jgi:hypothetical protein